MLIFFGHIWKSKQDLPFKLLFGNKVSEILYCFLKIFALFCLAPLAELLSLSLFIYYFKFPDTEQQVLCNCHIR